MAYSRDIKEHSSSTSTLIIDAARTPRLYKMIDDQGRYLTNDVLAEFNPWASWNRAVTVRTMMITCFGNISAELSIIDGLKLKGVAGGNRQHYSTYERCKAGQFLSQRDLWCDRNTELGVPRIYSSIPN